MDMGGEREGDCRIPFLYGLFFISCLTGGILLTMWLLDAQGSQPWFPVLALCLIGFPWFFWVLICCYSINKKCLMGGGSGNGNGNRAISRRASQGGKNVDLGSRRESPGKNGPVIVVDGGDPSIASDKESEMPLNRSSAS